MYKDYNDYELVNLIAESNEDATNIMYKKYEPLINSTAKKLSKYCENTGLDFNDLVQEGMLGLANAINSFSESKETLFYTFAKTCIERKMISSVIASRRLKHKILNDSLAIETTNVKGSNIIYDCFLGDNTVNPEHLMINEEEETEMITKFKQDFTNLEMQVFELKLNGFEYKEIAEILDKDIKSIDNALQRIKFKIKKYSEK